MGDRMPSLARRYGVAVPVVALAPLLTLAIPPVRNESPTALLFAAVMVSSWYGDLGAGLLATALATGAIPGRGREPVAGEATGPPRRVLIVEDWAATAQCLAELLEWWGYELRAARDGEVALDIARGYRPEVVLLDIGLPGMDGYEVARCPRGQAGPDRPRLVASRKSRMSE